MWQIDVCGMTDIGKKRPRNEDHFLVATLSKTLEISHSNLEIGEADRLFGNSQGRLLLVADGMGGHAAGDRASAMAVSAFADYVLNMLRWYFRADPTRDADLAADLRDAVRRCQRSIREEVSEYPEERGMGTTLTLAYVIWPRMFVVHVGDSRCYVLRDGKLKQLTRDHNRQRDRATPLFVTDGKRLTVVSPDTKLAPKPGQSLVSLIIPAAVEPQGVPVERTAPAFAPAAQENSREIKP